MLGMTMMPVVMKEGADILSKKEEGFFLVQDT